MKKLSDLGSGCKFALTTSPASDMAWSHARLADTKGGGAYPHMFCGEATNGRGPYCEKHHALCYRGFGKDARSLEEMMYATDQSQYRGGSQYADHTDPVDEEIRREKEPFAGSYNKACQVRRQEGA